MRAVGLPEKGGELQVLELPVPAPGAGEVLVNVRASSINPIDTYLATGHAAYADADLVYPFVPGRDFAGVVAEVGEQVENFAVGDEVMGFWSESEMLEGAWAEYDVIRATSTIVGKPAGVDFERAAAFSLAAMTARLCVDGIEPASGDVVLVTGAAGAVGCYAVQLAARQGATVIATAKAAHAERVLGLGAVEVIDYTHEDVFEAVHARHPDGIASLVDIVNDRSEVTKLAGLVREGGRVSSARYAADRKALAERGIAAVNVVANNSDPTVLAELAQLVGAGELDVLVDSVVPLDELPAAVAEFVRGGKGKIVVAVS